jgi:hypothetical protein
LDWTWACAVRGWQLPKLWHSLGRMVWFMSSLPDLNLWYQSGSWMNLTFRGPCIVMHSYNESQWDELFLKFIWWSTLHVSDRSTVHHQEYLNTVHMQ